MKHKIQIHLENEKAIKIYNMLKHGTRSKAIEQGLLYVAQNELLKTVFFTDSELVILDELLNPKKPINIENEKTLKTDVVQKKVEIEW